MRYFTKAELRALPDVFDSSRFPDARLDAAHDWIVSIIERECETTFIPTTYTETLTGSGADALFVSRPYVRSVDAVTVDATAWTTPEVEAAVVLKGAIYTGASTTWSSLTPGNVTITYTAGYSTTPPADLKEAALRAARNWLLTSDAWSGKDSRATGITNDYGNITLSVAGPDAPTGLPDVDATVMGWARKVKVPKVRVG